MILIDLAYISLIHYDDGEKRYILSPADLAVGAFIISGDNVPLKTGNALKLCKYSNRIVCP